MPVHDTGWASYPCDAHSLSLMSRVKGTSTMIRTQALRMASLAICLILMIGPASAQRAAPDRGEKYAFLVGVREYDPAELRNP